MSNNNLALLATAAYGKFHNLNNKDEIQNNLKKQIYLNLKLEVLLILMT